MICYFATSNKNKFLEVTHNTDLRFEQLKIDIPEIQGTQEEIALDKLAKVCAIHPDKWIMIDDTSIELKACIENLVSKIGRETTVSCTLGLGHHNKKILKLFTGSIDGLIVKGNVEEGFGFDHVFQPNGYDKVFGEMSTELKNKISHRGLAMVQLRDFLLNNKSI